MNSFGRQKGAYLVIMSFVMGLLIGLGALILDVGRLLILKNEMQNAVDAAALAAAVELDKEAGARGRAIAAAQSLLTRSATFTNANPSLLSATSLVDGNPLDQTGPFQFYCSIGYAFEQGLGSTFCSGAVDPNDSDKIFALGDEDTRYVRVTLSPLLAAAHFEIDLFFLPVLQLFNLATPVVARVRSDALAGNSFIPCEIPPLAICNPFEDPADPLANQFKDEMPEGGHIEIKVKGGGGAWTPGNFGLLLPPDEVLDELVAAHDCASNGAQLVGCFLAAPLDSGCTPPTFETKPGQSVGPTHAAIETRFDDYSGPFDPSNPTKWIDYPPDENIREFKDAGGDVYLDSGTVGADAKFDRFGSGTGWLIDDYWNQYHLASEGPRPPSLDGATRFEMYQYELDNGLSLDPNPAHPPLPERRELNIAVLQCDALGLSGKSSGSVFFQGGGFAKVFLLGKPPSGGGSDIFIPAEYIGWELLEDSTNETVVQLYE